MKGKKYTDRKYIYKVQRCLLQDIKKGHYDKIGKTLIYIYPGPLTSEAGGDRLCPSRANMLNNSEAAEMPANTKLILQDDAKGEKRKL